VLYFSKLKLATIYFIIVILTLFSFANFVDNEDFKKRLKKHDKWRQKQIDIFYRTGKPIFTMTLETQHLRSNNNPHHFIKKNRWDP